MSSSLWQYSAIVMDVPIAWKTPHTSSSSKLCKLEDCNRELNIDWSIFQTWQQSIYELPMLAIAAALSQRTWNSNEITSSELELLSAKQPWNFGVLNNPMINTNMSELVEKKEKMEFMVLRLWT